MGAFYLLIRLIWKTLQASGFILNRVYEIWKPDLESKKLFSPSHFLLLDDDKLSDQTKCKGISPRNEWSIFIEEEIRNNKSHKVVYK